jgi:RNA polymerase sigma-70 factor (ECF subfamily)
MAYKEDFERTTRCPLEADLMREVAADNQGAFTLIFERYYRLVLVTALRILGDIGEAEDVTQSIFLEIYRKAAQFDPSRGSLKNWILQYAYHRTINRKNYLSVRHFYDHTGEQTNSQLQPWEKTTVAPATQEARLLLTEALAILNLHQRQVLQMVFYEGLDLHEIATQIGQTFTNVRHHYYRGLLRLREALTTRKNELNAREPVNSPTLRRVKA